jgi:uncharacterized protein with PIN domain
MVDEMASGDGEITEIDQRSYARIQGQMCPYCGGKEIVPPHRFEFEMVDDGDKKMVRQRTECENCGRQWWDVFILSHIEEISTDSENGQSS